MEGKNYYWLDFEVTSPNQSEHRWPHLTANQYYDPQTVDFFLSHLRDIEEEAKRNDSKGIQSGPLQLMSSLERLGNEGVSIEICLITVVGFLKSGNTIIVK